MKILVLDNYDSFTYNLVHYIEQVTDCAPDVFRNDEIAIEAIKDYDAIVLSPGPGLPKDAGILKEVISTYAKQKPILGVCLGLQAIVEVFGGELENLIEVYHGVASEVKVCNESVLFKGLSDTFDVARYHSWVASKLNFPESLVVTCQDENGVIMGVRHQNFFIESVQFHPESILTPNGKQMLRNFFDAV